MSGFSLLRSDRGVLAPPISATIFEGRVARVHQPGDALMYTTGPEHRDADEVANIVKQLPGTKVYLGHPSSYPAKDSGQKDIGYIESARVDDEAAVARIVITDKTALDAISSGTYELSLGYQCTLDDKRYQKNVKIDHLAVVDRARCGATCALRTDEEGNTVKVELEITAEVKQALDAMMKAMSMPSMPGMPDKPMECTCPPGTKPEDCTCMNTDAELNAKKRNALATEEFAVPGSRKLPIHDESHVRAALSRFNQTDFESEAEKRTAYHKILAKAKSMGIDTSGFQKAHGDSAEDCTCKTRAMPHNNGETMSDTKTDLAAEAEALKVKLEEAHKALTALEVEATNARKDADKAKADLATAQAEASAARADADAALAKAKTDAEDAMKSEIDVRVEKRVALITEAKDYLKDTDISKLSDRDIKVAVIKHVDGDDVPADKSMDYVDGVYAGALKRGNKAEASRADARVTLNEMRKDNAPLRGIDAEKAAKEKLARESAQAWTK